MLRQSDERFTKANKRLPERRFAWSGLHSLLGFAPVAVGLIARGRQAYRRAVDRNLPPLTLHFFPLFRCAGRGEGTIESAARLTVFVAAGSHHYGRFTTAARLSSLLIYAL